MSCQSIKLKTVAEAQREGYIESMHYVLPEIEDSESALNYRRRCQVVLGEALWRADMLKRLVGEAGA